MERTWNRACAAGAALSLAAAAAHAIDFTAGTPVATASRPAGAAIADFNADGRNDLAVTVENPDRILIYFGNGDGTFGPPMTILTGANSGPDSILAVNIDGDTDVDLVVALHNANSVRTYINNGAGAFALGTSAATGNDPRKLTAVDLDNDTDLDFLVANRSDNSVTAIRNDARMLVAAATVPVGNDPRGVTAGDFDGDGDADLAVTNHGDRTISVLSGNGPFSYALAATLPVPPGTRPDGIAAADLDSDGDIDLAVTVSDPAFVSIYTNNAGVFAGPTSFSTGGVNSSEILLADLDLDGKPDAAVANAGSGNISVLQNTSAAGGPITFGAPSVIATGATPGQIAAGDLDSDTVPDLAVPNRDSDTTSILINNTRPPCAADFDGNGIVNSQDFFDFLTAFFTLLPSADFNADGFINSQDFFDFVTAFFVGCP